MALAHSLRIEKTSCEQMATSSLPPEIALDFDFQMVETNNEGFCQCINVSPS